MDVSKLVPPKTSSYINKNDLVNFIDVLNSDIRNIRQQSLLALNRYFGYERATFYLIDRAGNMHSPVLFEIDEDYAKQFTEHFYKLDIFHPARVYNKALEQKVLSINDVIGYWQFRNSEYYNSFLREQNLYHETAIFLSAETRLTGVISVFKDIKDKQFQANEISRLKEASLYISKALKNHLTLLEAEQQKEALMTYSDKASPGLIIFDRSLSVCFANDYVHSLCASMSDTTDQRITPELLLRRYLFDGNIPEYTNTVKHISLADNKLYRVQLMPAIHYDIKDDMPYMALISEQPHSFADTLQKHPDYSDLTAREVEIIELLVRGASNQEIADALYISTHTVKAHMQNIFKKMNVPNRTKLCYKINQSSR